MVEIFDVHIHCSELSNDALAPFARANGFKYNLDELLKLMQVHRVRSGLLLSPPLSSGLPVANSRIVDLCKRSDGKLFPILTVEPNRNSVSDSIKLARDLGSYVKGFKIRLGYINFFPYDKIFALLYNYAESAELPVLFHCGDTATSDGSLAHSHPLVLDPLANTRPDLKIVVCHFGNPWIMDTAELLYKHRNVFADVSGLFVGGSKYSARYLEFLSRIISEATYFVGNADKIMFGTDYPIEPFSSAISLVNKMKITRLDKENILSKNARRLFHF